MKITFVHRGRENLGIEYLSAILKKAGHKVSLAYDHGLFSTEDNLFYIPVLEKIFSQKNEVLKTIEKSNPDVIAFSVYTGTYKWCCDIAKEIKERFELPIIFGGVHPTLIPEICLSNDSVDYVVVGEGEEALLEYADGLPLEKIKNLCYKKNGRIMRNELRPLYDLEKLPLPDKNIFEKDVIMKDDYMLMASRGCIFNCTYCCESFNNKLYGKYYRRRSAESIISELVFMKDRYDFQEVMFYDSLFFTDKKWLKELLEKYKKEIAVPFRCFGKTDFLTEELAEILKDGGCYCIEFGMQTLNENIKRNILGRTESTEKAKNAFLICDKYALRYDIDHMFGLPGETENDHIEGARFYSSLKYLNRLKCHNLTYFPNLKITGYLSDDEKIDISNGKISNFFHNPSPKNEIFLKIYKIIPIIPTVLLKTVLKYRKTFKFIPLFVIMFLQLVVAIKGKDKRFWIYLKYYPLRIKKALLK